MDYQRDMVALLGSMFFNVTGENSSLKMASYSVEKSMTQNWPELLWRSKPQSHKDIVAKKYLYCWIIKQLLPHYRREQLLRV